MASEICAGYIGDGSNTCRGDSGGPLLVKAAGGKLAQIGVVSFGYECGPGSAYGVYGWIGAALPWIKKTRDQHGLKGRP